MLSSLNQTKKRFKKKIKNAKTNRKNSYKKKRGKFRKNKSEKKITKLCKMKNRTLKNKKVKKILFRVKNKIIDELKKLSLDGGTKSNNPSTVYSTHFTMSTTSDKNNVVGLKTQGGNDGGNVAGVVDGNAGNVDGNVDGVVDGNAGNVDEFKDYLNIVGNKYMLIQGWF
jgi:hypothetical protein